ncbi:MAG: cytochrome C oxidase subunit IV family protein [Bdellovibrionia bacterium]
MGSQHDNHTHHITPFSTYVKVAAALFALTFLTIIAHSFRVQLGLLAAPVAFLIAAVKAWLVMLWFMHLKYDTWVNKIVFGSSFFFLVLLFAIVFLDILTRVSESSVL